MIKVLSAFFSPSLMAISPGETTDSFNEKLMQSLQQNFQIEIQETSTGRTLPRDEILLDQREYYVNFTRLPSGI